LLANGPRGTYSHLCTSLADQSFSRQYPNTCSLASAILIGTPSSFPAPPTKTPTSSSKSSFAVGAYVV
jgi:hypothetical protein